MESEHCGWEWKLRRQLGAIFAVWGGGDGGWTGWEESSGQGRQDHCGGRSPWTRRWEGLESGPVKILRLFVE